MSFYFAWIFLILTVGTYCRKDGTYELFVDRGEIVFLNKNMINGYAFFYPYNRTTKALNASFMSNHDIPEKTVVKIEVFTFLHNEYRPTPIKISMNVKQMLSYTYFDVKRAYGSFNPPLRFPVKGNVRYSSIGYVIDDNNYPPALPFGKYKAVIEFLVPALGVKTLYKSVEFDMLCEIREVAKFSKTH